MDDGFSFGNSTIQQQTVPQAKDWSKILNLTDTSPYLQNLERKLRLQVLDLKTREWVTPLGVPPLMNDFGIQKITGFLSAFIDRTMSQANLERDKVLFYHILTNLLSSQNNDCFLFTAEYEINEKNMPYIKGILFNTSTLFLTRPLNDKERGFMYNEEKSTLLSRFIPNLGKSNKPSAEVYNN